MEESNVARRGQVQRQQKGKRGEGGEESVGSQTSSFESRRKGKRIKTRLGWSSQMPARGGEGNLAKKGVTRAELSMSRSERGMVLTGGG